MATRTDGSRVESRVILLSAATAARREEMGELIEGQMAGVDWSLLTELLRSQRLLPTLGPRILDFAAGAASQQFARAVAGAIDATRRQDALLQLISAMTMEALADAGISSTALKGPGLGEALYGEAGRRLSSDIDLLVAPEHLGRAVEVVRGLGYAKPTDYVDASGLPLLHFALVHERDELPPVELHWRVHWYETRFARERLLAPSGAGDWRPAPVDELTALLLFYARDGFTGLRQATDLGAWWDALGAELGPAALAESARSYPALAPALAAALTAAKRTVGFPAERAIGGSVALGARGRIAVRLADPHPYDSQAQLFAEIGLIDGLLAPPRGLLAFIRRQVAPPAEVIREHVEKAHRGRATSTLGYSLRVLGRYALAMARLLRHGEHAVVR
ncbi:MAG TPA: nucleotidyltransferase family protein [Solirubrobacterales bacterium]